MLQEPRKFPAVLDYLALCKPFPAIFTDTEKRHFALSNFAHFPTNVSSSRPSFQMAIEIPTEVVPSKKYASRENWLQPRSP